MSEWERIREANRIAAERMAMDRSAAAAELAVNATPETLRHRRACVVDELAHNGDFTPEQRRAAQEILLVWTSITSGLFAKVQRYEQRVAGSSHQDWRAATVNAYHARYIPWREEAGMVAVKGRTLADLVFLLVVDNYGVQQIGDSWKMDRRTVKSLCRTSLLRYAEIGGWVDYCGRVKNFA